MLVALLFSNFQFGCCQIKYQGRSAKLGVIFYRYFTKDLFALSTSANPYFYLSPLAVIQLRGH